MPEPSAVAAALGLPAVTAASRMTGYDAVVWRAELADGRTVALRLLAAGVSGDREATALLRAARHTELAPTLLASGSCAGRAALAMSWCPGRPIGDLLGEDADPHMLGIAFGAAQRALHRPVAGRVLCHLDYQPFNVLAADGRATGIVDWGNSRIDDPRADLACTAVILAFAPALLPDLAAGITQFTAGWRAGYEVMPGDAALRPFLAAAARKQRAVWERRDGAPRAALDRVRELAEHYAL